jgi:hypothetical protein
MHVEVRLCSCWRQSDAKSEIQVSPGVQSELPNALERFQLHVRELFGMLGVQLQYVVTMAEIENEGDKDVHL